MRMKYLRYADDWVVGICGSQALAEDIKREIKTFLGGKLKLTLSEEKTHITNARTEEAFFLGTTLKIGYGGEAKVKLQTTRLGYTFKRRTTGCQTVMNAPLSRPLRRIRNEGFV